MCMGPSMPRTAAPIIPAPDNAEAGREASLARALMRRRAGAAANILTSPGGIATRPMTPRLGAPA